MRIASGIMLAVFLLSMAVQYNDEDGLLWMFYYGVSAALTVAALFERYTVLAPIAFVPYVAGSAWLLPAWNPITLMQLLREPKMVNNDVELARESLGLAICAVWMLVLTSQWYKRRAAMTA